MCTENLNPNVMVMKSAKDGVRFDASGPLNRERERSVFVQRPVRSDVVVIAGVSFEGPLVAERTISRRVKAFRLKQG